MEQETISAIHEGAAESHTDTRRLGCEAIAGTLAMTSDETKTIGSVSYAGEPTEITILVRRQDEHMLHLPA